jgi:YfiH family protein
MINVENALTRINRFAETGYLAGIILKRGWRNQRAVYDFLRSHLPKGSVKIVVPRQVHGADIAIAGSRGRVRNMSADGLLSLNPDVCLTIRTADCIPVLLADPGSGLFGAVHVGWRGLVAGILEETFFQIRNSGGSPGEMICYMGPAIGKCCFEVGDEVAAFFDDQYIVNRKGRLSVDMPGYTRNKIVESGVDESNLVVDNNCTSCGDGRYYSYRRDGEAPVQMVSFICRSQ